MTEHKTLNPEASAFVEDFVHTYKGMDMNMQCRGHQLSSSAKLRAMADAAHDAAHDDTLTMQTAVRALWLQQASELRAEAVLVEAMETT